MREVNARQICDFILYADDTTALIKCDTVRTLNKDIKTTMKEIAAAAEVVECFGIHLNDKLIRWSEHIAYQPFILSPMQSFLLSYVYSFLCWWYYAVRAATNVLKVVKSKKSVTY